LGHDRFENNPYASEYEYLLFRKISENINYKDQMKINNLIEEALLNVSFISLLKIDSKNIKIIVKEIQQCLEQYIAFEIHEPHIVEQTFKKSSTDFLIDFFQRRKRGNSFQQLGTDLSNIDITAG